jgi:DNA-binding response OmpR family regulator
MSKRILVVDGESSIREALSKVLHAENYEVAAAANGREAVEAFISEKIDLAVLDIGLPVQDGWHTFEWLSRVNPFLPVIIITGRSHQGELAEKKGVDAIMEKPLDVPRLLQLIQVLVVDDAPRIRGSLHQKLRAEGYDAVLAPDESSIRESQPGKS